MNLRGETLNIESLDDCFRALTGYAPYRWQRRLYESLVAGEKYAALDLPTGLGKTSIIPLWLLARASGADLPRRLVYVVDRRAVVDQATAVADEIAKRLHPQATGVAAELRAALGLTGEATLPVSTLRGQHVDNRRWLENPESAAIIVGTVDMIGSRLLFAGYGVSRRMRPVHAGLLGADTLILLDEAHLSPAFAALVERIVRMRSSTPTPVPNMTLMALSATRRGRARDELQERIFSLDAEDVQDAPVRLRLDAAKLMRILPEVDPRILATILAQRAQIMGKDGRAVLVFCDSRKVAQDVAELLLKDKEALVDLLVGERRVYDRTRLTNSKAFKRFLPERERVGHRAPAFLVATSAGEVGVDLDADDLVCDLVSFERMVQRLGRVNRRPTPGIARIEVIPSPRETKRDADAETEADETQLYVWLRALEELPSAADGEARSASPSDILNLTRRASSDPDLDALLRQAVISEPLRPELTLALVEAWAMTSLEKHTARPEPGPWIRGWTRDPPQARAIWRAFLPLPQDFIPTEEGTLSTEIRPTLTAFFEAAPPHVLETLDAPAHRLADVLKRQADAWLKRERNEEDQGPTLATCRVPVVVLLDSADTPLAIWGPRKIKSMKSDDLKDRLVGCTAVIDKRFGGLDPSGLLSVADAEPPVTWDDGWDERALQQVARRLRRDSATYAQEDVSVRWAVDWRWSPVDDEETSDEEFIVERLVTEPAAGDAARSVEQKLGEHHQMTREDACRIIHALRLPPDMRDVLLIAAGTHDLGKNRPAWQSAVGAPLAGRPFAKTSGRRSNPELLQGYRHEFGSLRDAEAQVLAAIAPELRDLARHLIAAHHGFARPVIKAQDPDAPPSVTAPLAQEAALRFDALQQEWTPWGLAWWEALLRAADWSASRRAAEHRGLLVTQGE